MTSIQPGKKSEEISCQVPLCLGLSYYLTAPRSTPGTRARPRWPPEAASRPGSLFRGKCKGGEPSGQQSVNPQSLFSLRPAALLTPDAVLIYSRSWRRILNQKIFSGSVLVRANPGPTSQAGATPLPFSWWWRASQTRLWSRCCRPTHWERTTSAGRQFAPPRSGRCGNSSQGWKSLSQILSIPVGAFSSWDENFFLSSHLGPSRRPGLLLKVRSMSREKKYNSNGSILIYYATSSFRFKTPFVYRK